MKVFKLFITVVSILTVFIFTPGCEYDVAEPGWDKAYTPPDRPSITTINPGAAVAGVNTISIQGSNFVIGEDTTKVYFDEFPAEIISLSSTEIVVRRPNPVGTSVKVKVIPAKTDAGAFQTNYTVSKVFQQYGQSFIEKTLVLAAIAVDKEDNIYVAQSASKQVFKVTPGGVKTLIDTATRVPTDMKIDPDGRLILVSKNRALETMDIKTGEVKEWVKLGSGKVVNVGDFDAAGNFYTGGNKSNLWIIKPDLTFSEIPGAVYTKDEIQSIRVYDGYVYLLVKTAAADALNPANAVFRHVINGDGTLGPKELYLDLTTTGLDFTERVPKSITFSSDGKIFIATDSSDPLLYADPSTKKIDFFYKDILAPYCKQIHWGNGTGLFMIIGNSTVGKEEDWTIYKTDMGMTGAPYLGVK